MGNRLKLFVLLIGAALIFGCASPKSSGTANQETSGLQRPSYEASIDENDPLASQKLVKKAHSAIGTPYVLGGSKPGGFDCSGLVKWAYNSVGIDLPRTAREQSTVGQKIRKVEDMRAGDIVAFKHPKRGYHTGIYVGDGKFIHSPRQRTRVRINSLDDPYFSSTLLGARRVNLGSSEQIVAQAESRLDEYIAERSKNHSIAALNIKKNANKNHKTLTSSKKQSAKTVAKASTKSQSKGKNAKTATRVKDTKKQLSSKSKSKSIKQVAKAQTAKKAPQKSKTVSMVTSKKAKNNTKSGKRS